MIVSALSLTFATSSTFLAKAYNVSIVEVNMCGITFTATFVPMTFVAMWMYKALRTDTVLRIACITILFGAWLRMFAADGLWWPVLLGQVIVSLAQPVVYNVMA